MRPRDNAHMSTDTHILLNTVTPLNLPDSDAVTAGSVIRVQICPFGEFRQRTADGTVVSQLCDRHAFERIIRAAKDGGDDILVDFEHRSETGGDTDAAAWIKSLEIDDEDGLVGHFALTDVGAEALRSRRIRYLSPALLVDKDGRPCRLTSVALTNKPNIPVRPILNRAGDNSTVEDQAKDTATMDLRSRLIELLGLPAEATDDQIAEAVTVIKNTCAEAEEKALNAEAEAAADENKDLVANRADFIAAYKRDPQTVRMVLNSVAAPKHDTQQPPKPATRVLNRAEAARPNIPGLTCPDVDPLAKCRTPEERIAARTGRHL